MGGTGTEEVDVGGGLGGLVVGLAARGQQDGPRTAVGLERARTSRQTC